MASKQGSKGIPKRSRSEKAKSMRKSSYNAAQARKKENLKAQKEAEQANRDHAKSDPQGLTAYQRRKFDKNHERIVKKFGSFRPGLTVGGE